MAAGVHSFQQTALKSFFAQQHLLCNGMLYVAASTLKAKHMLQADLQHRLLCSSVIRCHRAVQCQTCDCQPDKLHQASCILNVCFAFFSLP